MSITENAIFAVYRGVTGFQQAARSNPLQVGKFHINQALANDDRQKKIPTQSDLCRDSCW